MAVGAVNVGAVRKWHVATITTTTEVKPYRFISGSTGTYVAAGAANDGGVTDKDVASTYDADAIDAGIVPVYCQAAVAVGPVEVAGSAGGIQTKVSGVIVGKALTAGAAGDLALVVLSSAS